MVEEPLRLDRALTTLDIDDGGRGGEPPRRPLDSAIARVGAIAAALLLVVFLVISVSRAAFVVTTENTANSVSTGTISLTDDDADVAMFDAVTGLAPLDVVTNCIAVEYSGSLDPLPIRLYSAGAPTGTLGSSLDLQIQMGTGGSFGDCAGFTSSATLYTGTVTGFADDHDEYANGLATWDPDPGTGSRTFRFTLTVQDVPEAVGASTTFGYVWETRSS